MNEKIFNHVKVYNEAKGWDATEESIIETMREGTNLYREEIDHHRWWNVFFYVVEIDGMLIGYEYAEANRDESVSELGYDFDVKSVCEVEKVEKTIITYEPKK